MEDNNKNLQELMDELFEVKISRIIKALLIGMVIAIIVLGLIIYTPIELRKLWDLNCNPRFHTLYLGLDV